MFEVTLSVAAIAMAGVGVWIVAFNYHVWISCLRGRPNTPSYIPIIGGLMVAGAMLIVPINGLWKLAWIPLLVDWACVPLLLDIAVWWLGPRKRRW